MMEKTCFKNIILIILSLFFIFLTGCGQQSVIETNSSQEEIWKDDYLIDDEYIVVGFVQVGSESDWRTANTESFKSTFTEEKGYYFIYEDGQQKQENQLKSVRSLILQEADYIILDPVIETGWDAVLQEAKDAEIPVILVDRTVEIADEDLYTCWIGSDFYQEGELAAKWLADYLENQSGTSGDASDEASNEVFDELENTSSDEVSKESSDESSNDTDNIGDEDSDDTINIVTLQGTLDSSAQIGRTEGFAAIASTMSNWNILDQQSGDFTQSKGKEVMEYFLKTYDNIDVVVSENDNMAFGAIEAIEEAGMTCGSEGDIIILSFDAVRDALQEIINGNICADFECNPMLGPLAEEVIQALENGETVEKIQYADETYFDASMDLEQILEERTY